jgi:glucose/arabinose dehydrogenase
MANKSKKIIGLLVLVFALQGCSGFTPKRLPIPENFTWSELPYSFEEPVYLANAGDGSGRLFVLEKKGKVFIISDGEVLARPFLDIEEDVRNDGIEIGFLGLAFHPDYKDNGFIYISYTKIHKDTTLSRFRVSDDPNRILHASERKLMIIEQPNIMHQGGHLEFGADGFLYMSVGDGGNDDIRSDNVATIENNAQNLENILGTIIRIDVDDGDLYSIPEDNPYVDSDNKAEIWAYGLRNPWRFNIDAKTGEMYIADVGQDKWEEVNYLPAKYDGRANFGWRFFEGTNQYSSESPPDDLELIFPVTEYENSEFRCAVIGGVVYRGDELPAWQGVYLYADFCSGEVFGLLRDANGDWLNEVLYTLPLNVTSFGVDEEGEIYIIGFGEGPKLYKLEDIVGQ